MAAHRVSQDFVVPVAYVLEFGFLLQSMSYKHNNLRKF